jgi:hypothetical protein
MSEHPAKRAAMSAPAADKLAALTRAIDKVTYWTWPRTWTHRGATTSAAELAAAVAAAVRATAAVADHLGVALSPARPAPADDLDTTARQMIEQLDGVANVVNSEASSVGALAAAGGSRLDALVAAVLAVADQRSVTAQVQAILGAATDGHPDPAAGGAPGSSAGGDQA